MPSLEKLIREKKAKVCVVGLGYVGLPLSVEFAKKGFKVTGLDRYKEKVDSVNKGKSYILDVSDEKLRKVVKKGNLKAQVSFSAVEDSDIIFLCVPTPIDEYKVPNLQYVESVSKDVSPFIKKDCEKLIILESTTYPGTTEEVILPILEGCTISPQEKFRAGKDFYLAYSAERVDPGNKIYHTGNVPKVVGGVTKRCTKLAALIYSFIISKVVPVSSCRVAEMTKLLENIFRIVNISMINELAVLCKKMDIDIWEVIKAAETKPYGFMPFYPGPGIGGHCIPVDPFYLSWKAKEFDFTPRFIELAGEINDSMPYYIVKLVDDALNSKRASLKASKILVIGVTYKKDVMDIRESPVLKIMKILLKEEDIRLSYHDPFISELTVEEKIFRSSSLTKNSIKKADCVLIATDHSNVDYNLIKKNAKLIVDTRNVIKDRNIKNVFRL
ncbi:UDP-N-acetyl-D-glucosamine dehydrogenase [bacterium (Candidatus Torokbacteria) CG_4_10_14_0_2_um_filter_35_8]|nr:MAG: UDP-N-acetyl-D-glucosamine dehydrogenase [bacterium (Candidatus Torokbacteria) CG_4_10_14_0_2_um_filter_35_8]